MIVVEESNNYLRYVRRYYQSQRYYYWMNRQRGCDPWKKERVGELFRKLQKEGTTIVMATHDIEFAAKYVDRCMMLFDGAVIMNDAPKEFLVVTSFIQHLLTDSFEKNCHMH